MEITTLLFNQFELFIRADDKYRCGGWTIGTYGDRESIGYSLKNRDGLNSDFWKRFIDEMPDRNHIFDLNLYLNEGNHVGKVVKKISGEKNLELIVLKSKKRKLYQDSILPIDVTQLEIPENRVDVGNNLRIFMYPMRVFNWDEDKLSFHPRAIMLANDSYGFAYRRK